MSTFFLLVGKSILIEFLTLFDGGSDALIETWLPTKICR